MMSLKYDDIEPSDEDEASESDSTFESFQTSSCSSMSEYRWPPCLEIEEIDQGWIRFSRTSSSKSSISSLSLNKARLYPQPWRFNWMKGLFASSGILGKPNPITPVVEQLKPSNTFDDPMETVTVGEWGGLMYGGRPFDHRGYDGIKTIIIYYNHKLNSIRIQYTKQGKLEWTEEIGANLYKGLRHEIVLDDPDEYITQVTGWYNTKRQGISQLTFISNRKTHGPFGTKEAPWVDEYEKYVNGGNLSDSIPFGYSGGKLVGFQGSKYLSSIGFHVSYLPYSCENDGNKCIMSTATTMQHVPNISQAPCRFHQIYVDMFGYPSRGIPFQHGEYDGIKRIFIGHGIKWINFFMVEYMKSGQPQLSQGIGQRGGSSTSTEIVLYHPREFLQTVRGNYLTDEQGEQFELSGDKIVGFHDEVGKFEGLNGGITSLTFYSNVRKYGPFGYERGQQFEASGGKIVGFQGTADEYGLRAIGFHIVPTNSLQEL